MTHLARTNSKLVNTRLGHEPSRDLSTFDPTQEEVTEQPIRFGQSQQREEQIEEQRRKTLE